MASFEQIVKLPPGEPLRLAEDGSPYPERLAGDGSPYLLGEPSGGARRPAEPPPRWRLSIRSQQVATLPLPSRSGSPHHLKEAVQTPVGTASHRRPRLAMERQPCQNAGFCNYLKGEE